MRKPDNSYIVRIYRRAERAERVHAPELIQLVEDPAGGERHAFHTAQELWRILGRRPPDEDPQPRVKR